MNPNFLIFSFHHGDADLIFSIVRVLIPILAAVGVIGEAAMILTIISGRLRQTAFVYLAFIAVADAVFLASQWVSELENCESCEFRMTTMIIIKRFTW